MEVVASLHGGSMSSSQSTPGGPYGRGQGCLRVRSLVTLGMLVALDRPGGLKGHINGALNNGATADETYDVFLQAAVYCGVPAAHTGVAIAAEVFGDRGLL